MKIQSSIRRTCGRCLAVAGLALMSAATAQADYQSTVLADKPVAFYALNPAVDGTSTAPDLTGNGNDGFAANIAAADGPSPYITNAANFNGSAAIDLSQNANAGLLNFAGPITLEAWAQPNSSSLFADILAKGYDSATYQEIVIRVNGPYGANYYGSSGTTGVTGGNQTTNWTYIVLSSDGTNCTLYENGLKVAQSADTGGSVTFGDDWVIGNGSSLGNGRLFNGNISEVAIYTNGLSASQVLNHYFVGLVNTPANLSVPIITAQPQSQPSYVGGTVTLSVTAVSALPMTNQWYEGSTPLLNQTNATLTLSDLQLTNAGTYSVVVGNANGITNSALAVLTVSTPRNLQWSANGNSGTWDTSTTANWINLADSSQVVFNPGDTTLFDDTAGVPTSVSVPNNVYPSVMTVNSSANAFTFNGSGIISGTGSIIKEGTSTLTIDTPRGFAGSVAVGGGKLYAGNNTIYYAASLSVSNNSTLDFGGGSFNALTPITVSGTGDTGEGALYNSYADYPSEAINVTMTGDTLFGGSARWDLASGSQIHGAHTLTLDWSGGAGYGEWNSVTVGSAVAGITLTNGTLGSKNNDTSFQNSATVFTVAGNSALDFYSGGWNGSLHLQAGASVNLWSAPSPFNGNTITMETGCQWLTKYNSADEPINSAVILNGVVHMTTQDHNMDYTNIISGSGGFVLDITNYAVVLSASNTYSGPTVVGSDSNTPYVALTGNGSITHSALIFFGGSDPTVTHIDVSGRSDQTLTLASGQTLAGVGAVAGGNLVVSPGATLSPSGTNTEIGITSTSTNGVGGIEASGNITLGGTTVIKLAAPGSNDVVQAGGNLTYGGTLNLVNVSGAPLASGNSFQIFSAANYHGVFTGIVPATPGAGLAWNTNQLSSGLISVVGSSGPVIGPVLESSGKLIFSGTGGTAGGTYYVLSATNVSGPWTTNATYMYDSSGNFSVTNPISAGIPQVFYRIQQ